MSPAVCGGCARSRSCRSIMPQGCSFRRRGYPSFYRKMVPNCRSTRHGASCPTRCSAAPKRRPDRRLPHLCRSRQCRSRQCRSRQCSTRPGWTCLCWTRLGPVVTWAGRAWAVGQFRSEWSMGTAGRQPGPLGTRRRPVSSGVFRAANSSWTRRLAPAGPAVIPSHSEFTSSW
jgi:hypothetical protein